jgi:hypothetical protein
LAHAFRFINAGKTAVEIVAARPGCGCLQPELPKTRIEPQESSVIPVQVRTLGQGAGPRTWQLHLSYRAEGTLKECTLEIKARVIAEITVQPAALTIDASTLASHEIVLSDLRAAPLAIDNIKTSSRHLSARVLEPTRKQHWHFPIRLEVGPELPAGRHDETVHIYTTDPIYPHLQVPITLVKRSPSGIVVQPAEVVLRAAPGQPFPARLVRLSDRGGQPVQVAKVNADHPALICAVAPGPDTATTLKIQVDPAKLTGPRLSGVVRVEVSAPMREMISIPMSCYID